MRDFSTYRGPPPTSSIRFLFLPEEEDTRARISADYSLVCLRYGWRSHEKEDRAGECPLNFEIPLNRGTRSVVGRQYACICKFMKSISNATPIHISVISAEDQCWTFRSCSHSKHYIKIFITYHVYRLPFSYHVYRLMNKQLTRYRNFMLYLIITDALIPISLFRPSGSFAGILAGLMRFIGIRFSLSGGYYFATPCGAWLRPRSLDYAKSAAGPRDCPVLRPFKARAGRDECGKGRTLEKGRSFPPETGIGFH